MSKANFGSSNIQKMSKTVKSMPGGRDAKVDPDLYYQVKDENELLKRNTLALNEKIKKLEANLTNVKEGVIKERMLADRKGLKIEGFDKSATTTKLENEKLKLQNDKLRLYIKGLQSDSKFGQKKKTTLKKTTV